MREPQRVHQAIRTLPLSLDSAGAAWASEDHRWIAVFGSSDEALPARLYCRSCQRLPSGWKPLGRGWEAFDLALLRAEALRDERAPAAPKKGKGRAYRDPREFRY